MATTPFNRSIMDYVTGINGGEYDWSGNHDDNQAALHTLSTGQNDVYQQPGHDAWQTPAAPPPGGINWGNTDWGAATRNHAQPTSGPGLHSSWGGGAASLAQPTSSSSGQGLNGLALPGGWNAGGNKFQYNIPQGFQANTNLFQHGYDPNQDTAGIDVGRGAQTQSNLDRVYGWMNSVAKANGFSDISQMPPDKQQQAMSYAVGRLRTDSFASDPSGASWQRTGFGGYDKYLVGGGGGGQQSAAGGQQMGGGQSSQGGQPSQGGQQAGGGQFPSGPNILTAEQAAKINANNPLANVKAGQQMGGDDGQNQRNMALIGAPEFAMNKMMEAIGLAPGANNAFANSIRNTLKPQLGRFMQLQGIGDGQRNFMDSAETSLNEFSARVNSGSGLFEGLQNFANAQKQAAFTPGSTFLKNDNETQMAALSQLTALGTSGMNPLMQSAWKNYYDTAAYESQKYDLAQLGPNNNNRTAADWLRNSKWADLLR